MRVPPGRVRYAVRAGVLAFRDLRSFARYF